MTCTRIDLPGGGIAIACTRGPRATPKPAPCVTCGAPTDRLCDHRLSDDGKTCDAPCCAAHRLRFGREFDLCKACAIVAGRWPLDAAGQPVAAIADCRPPASRAGDGNPFARGRGGRAPAAKSSTPTAPATTATTATPLGPGAARLVEPPPLPAPPLVQGPRATTALHVLVIGSVGHGALADVHAQIAAYPAGVTLYVGDRRGVEEEAAIVARRRGLRVQVIAQRPGETLPEHTARIVGEAVALVGTWLEADVFPWPGEGGPPAASCIAARRAADHLGVAVHVHQAGAPRLVLWTARLGASKDPDELDITRGTAGRYAPDAAHRILADFDRHRAAKAHAESLAGSRLFTADKALRTCGWGTLGAPWAPSAMLLSQGKAGLDFPAYAERYRAEMRVSYGAATSKHGELERMAVARGAKASPLAWRWLREQPRVVAACVCTDGPETCHRGTFAQIWTALGAHYAGEIGAHG